MKFSLLITCTSEVSRPDDVSDVHAMDFCDLHCEHGL